jgi:hypothetical protein
VVDTDLKSAVETFPGWSQKVGLVHLLQLSTAKTDPCHAASFTHYHGTNRHQISTLLSIRLLKHINWLQPLG